MANGEGGGLGETWGGASLLYWYLSIDGAHTRNIWISPSDLYDALILSNRQHATSEHQEDSAREEISPGRVPFGGVAKSITDSD